MTILAVESSTAHGSVALWKEGRLLAEESSPQQRHHSELLNPAIDRILSSTKVRLDQVEAFVVGCGPGSFTGIRVASNIAKTLAWTYGRPLVPVDTLVNLAFQAGPQKIPVLAVVNAFKNMVYFALYEVDSKSLPRVLVSPSVSPLAELESHLPEGPVYTVGDALPLLTNSLSPESMKRFLRPPSAQDWPRASAAAELGELLLSKKDPSTFDWKSFVPLYLRASEAEEKKRVQLLKQDKGDRIHGTESREKNHSES